MKHFTLFLLALALPVLASCTAGNLPRIKHPVSYSGTLAKSMVEGERTVTGRLQLPPPTEDHYPDPVILASSGEKIEACWPELEQAAYTFIRTRGQDVLPVEERKALGARAFSKIEPSENYRIELLTRIYREPNYVFNDVLRVSKGDQVLIDTSICHVHRLPMQRQLFNGCSAEDYPESFFPLQEKKFPNDGNEYLRCGSGIIHPTWKCPECSRAYQAWAKKQGWKT